METSKSKIFAQFTANLFAGGSFVFAGMWLLLLKFGLDTPRYSLAILLVASIAGILASEIITRKYEYKFYFINVGLFLILPAILTLIMGIEDWQFAGMISLMAILYTILPTIIIMGAINWRKIFRKK